VIYVLEHHDRLLELWREQDRREIRLVHVDFHDDLRGLLVDRSRGKAHPIGALARGQAPPDPGNFLAHAVMDGRLRSVLWVHGDPGGRAWDMGIVRYESDWLALHHRLAHRFRRGAEYALAFRELPLDGWAGCAPGDLLSVDWDCFASVLLDDAGLEARVKAFLERLGDTEPEETYVVYSPEYSHPSLGSFRGLVDELGRRFGQPVTWLSPGLQEGRIEPRLPADRLPRDPLRRLILLLRRRGFY
jgi:hypothetical protein